MLSSDDTIAALAVGLANCVGLIVALLRAYLKARRELLAHPAAKSYVVAAPDDGSLRVLFVDDDEHTRNAVARFLRSRGYHVRTASTANEAIALSRAHVFDAHIVDLNLRGMYGDALLEALRPTAIVFSGSFVGDEGDAERLVGGARVDALVPKGTDHEALVDAIEARRDRVKKRQSRNSTTRPLDCFPR